MKRLFQSERKRCDSIASYMVNLTSGWHISSAIRNTIGIERICLALRKPPPVPNLVPSYNPPSSHPLPFGVTISIYLFFSICVLEQLNFFVTTFRVRVLKTKQLDKVIFM